MQHKLKSRRGICAWILLAVVSSLLTQPSLANPAQANPSSEENAPTNDPPARVARISDLKGNVSFLRAGLDQWSEAALNFPATTGDRIYTDNGARAELEVGPYTIRMWEKTDLTITNLTDQVMQLGLEQGKLRVTVSRLPSGNTAEVDTPNGTLTLLAAGKYRVDADATRNRTVVSVSSGSLEVSGGEVSQTVQTGQAVELTGQDPIQVNPVTMPPMEDFDIWSEERDQRLASSSSAKYVSPSTPGYEDLDTDGHWSMAAEYGPVWYPVVTAGWVPYRFGHWVWIDPWGWTWVEDEPWGFCPFHYGRWVFIGAAWGWLPGPFVVAPVYAPALVAFLGGPNFSVGAGLVGWFPLGPGEPYFPWYHHSGRYLNEVNVTNIRNVTNITNITNINNVHYAYRTTATTAVPRDVLRSGKPVAHQMVRVSPQQLARADIIPHPPVNPTKRAAVSGKPVPPPPIRTQHLVGANRTTQVAGKPAPAGNRQSVPLATKNAPRTGNAERIVPPPPNVRTQSSSRGPSSPPRAIPPRAIPPRLITRIAPPHPPVPFEQWRPAMSEHPGRPLEPPQLEDLRVGRPVGRMHDREFPPHVAPVIPERPAPVPARPRFSPVKPK